MNDDYRKGYLAAYGTFVGNWIDTMQSEIYYVHRAEPKDVKPLTINGVPLKDLFNMDQFNGDNS